MIIRDARFTDVEEVMDKLSNVSLYEMGRAGVENAWQGLRRAKMCKDKGFLKVAFDGDTPMFIFGAVTVDSCTMRTWFIATEQYFDKKVSHVKDTARFMAEIAARYPNRVFEAISLSNHPSVNKWFAAIGFSRVKYTDGGTIYRHVGRRWTKQ